MALVDSALAPDADPYRSMHWTLILGTTEWFDFAHEDFEIAEAIDTGVIARAYLHRALDPQHKVTPLPPFLRGMIAMVCRRMSCV